tara:strand:+ start:107 stop:493 length:387 start_codon:yes stop_codon:yes gene_type:complete
MSNYSEEEFQRVMSNPPNEIISDSLKGRLKDETSKSSSHLSILVGEEEHSCILEGFSSSESLLKVDSITVSLREELVGRILNKSEFCLKSTMSEQFNINFEQISKFQCFRYDKDIYILELSLGKESDD